MKPVPRVIVAAAIATFGAIGSAGLCQQKPPAMPSMQERRATVVLKVPGYAAARVSILKVAAAHGAIVMGGHTEVNLKGKEHGWIDYKAPASQFSELIAALRPFGKLYAERITSSDHSSEYEELPRRLLPLQQHQARLLKLLVSPRLRGSDILYIQDRVYRAGIDQALLAQRRANLERMAERSEVMVELFEPGSVPGPAPRSSNLSSVFAVGIAHARAAAACAVSRAATAAAFVLVFAPLWIPGLLAAAFFLRWVVRRVVPALIAAGRALFPSLSRAVRDRTTLIGARLASRRTRHPFDSG